MASPWQWMALVLQNPCISKTPRSGDNWDNGHMLSVEDVSSKNSNGKIFLFLMKICQKFPFLVCRSLQSDALGGFLTTFSC